MEKNEEKKASEAARTLAKLGASKGGKARAEALTPEERRSIAREAIKARWARREGNDEPELPKAIRSGVLTIKASPKDINIQCAVFKDKAGNAVRVLTQRSFSTALGRHKNPNRGQNSIADLPVFLAANNLQPFISEELRRSLTPVCFISEKSGGVTKAGEKGGNIAFGYRAELLPQVCNVWLEAYEANVLLPRQLHIAERCKILIKGFAVIGILALVDEATGYQEDRPADELRKILAAYVSPELLPYESRFPHEFYKQICRLNGWTFNPSNPAEGPRVIGKITNHLIYDKLPKGVLEELRRKNPIIRNGRREHKHYRFLTEDIGDPHLEKQVASVTTLMRISPNKRVFDLLFERAFPTPTPQIEMALDDDNEIWSMIETGAQESLHHLE
jgi:P63C domain